MLCEANWSRHIGRRTPEAEELLQRRKDRIRAETKALGGARTVAKRPVYDISEGGTEHVLEVAVVEPLSPAPTTPVRREPKRRLPTLSAVTQSWLDAPNTNGSGKM